MPNRSPRGEDAPSEYGLQPPAADVAAAKDALARIVEIHRKRREQEARKPMVQMSLIEPEAAPVVEPMLVAEEVIDFQDGTWIEVRLPILQELRESDGRGRPDIVRYLITGRYHSTWRKRVPADEDALFELLPAPYPKLPEPPTLPQDSILDRHHGDSDWQPGAHPSLIRALVSPDQPVDEGGADSFHRWMRDGFGR